MSRIRQIKPAFFKDPDMADLSPSVRLFYIGLWTLADDAGYYRWDVAEVGVELYGFDPRHRREAHAIEYRDDLVKARRIEVFPDCPHLFIPTFTEHQRFAGPTKRFLGYEREHLACPQSPADARGKSQSPAEARPVNGIGTGTGTGTGSERFVNGKVVRAEERNDGESESDFRKRVGVPAFLEKPE